MTDSLYIGIDTSNYKTSIAATDAQGGVLFEKSELLEVPKGGRGLRQSEAFFAHSNRLPGYIREMFEAVGRRPVAAIGVSERPRRVEGSYMPCFLAGVNAAEITGAAAGVPVLRFSHQEGHVAAVLEGGPGQSGPFQYSPGSYGSIEYGPQDTWMLGGGTDACADSLFMHLSGGTTEFLICRPDSRGYDMRLCGGTKDISIGQLLDRFGVALGMDFPSGKYLDDAAFEVLSYFDFSVENFKKAGTTGIIPSIRLESGRFNLSGAETRLVRYVADIGRRSPEGDARLAAELFCSISELLAGAASALSEEYGIDRVYMAGGVASSRTIRALFNNMSLKPAVIFGKPELSGDNAVGIARLALRCHQNERPL